MLRFPLRQASKNGVAPSLSASGVRSRDAISSARRDFCDSILSRLGCERLIMISWNICRKRYLSIS
jgi:hypothetical protein